MPVMKGIPLSPGYAEGVAVVYDYEVQRRVEIPPRSVSPSETPDEHYRLQKAANESREELSRAEDSSRAELRSNDAAGLLAAQSMLVGDIAEKVHEYVHRELVNAEQALDAVVSELAERLGRLENAYLREREQDIRDVGRRMLRHLTGAPAWPPDWLPPGSVVVARELLPSEALALARSGLVAIVAEHGGPNSHTAILARSLGIPAVAGICQVPDCIQPGTRLLVNGRTGEVTTSPSSAELARFSESKRAHQQSAAVATADESLPCVTRDGVAVTLMANIARPEEAEQVNAHHLAGVGLFRTEFLFLESDAPPTLGTQIDAYGRVAQTLGNLPLVIRTFDLGGDKIPRFLSSPTAAPHPSLALRGLRFSLSERRLLETQLRALVQLAQERDVRVLFPMVIGRDDLARAGAALASAMENLGVQRGPLVGAMIETPAALFSLDEILDAVDFLAIGTNDLSQYMLALDRDEADLSDECTPWHPLVLRAINQVVQRAAGRDCPVSVCGEDAGDPEFACLLLGLGVRELSLSPARAAEVRQALRSVRCEEMEKFARRALDCSSPAEVRGLAAEFCRETSVTG